MVLLPVIFAVLDGFLPEVFATGAWRLLYFQPAIILYILVISPFQRRARERVITGLRPIVELSDDEFNEFVSEQTSVSPRVELLAIAIGALAGWLLLPGIAVGSDTPWLRVYQAIFTVLMYGAIAWIIYISISSTRVLRQLLRQPLQVNILDIRPFEPVGSQSLLLSLAFVIGATLAMAFFVTPELVITFESLVVYAGFALVTVLLFVLNMYDTFRVLSTTKKREMNFAQDHISEAYQLLTQNAEQGEDIESALDELNTWTGIKQRIGKAQTWPHSADIVAKLVASTLLPLVISGLRYLGSLVLGMIELPF
jgi:hypothetical protein